MRLLAIGSWLFIMRLLTVGYWPMVIGFWFLVVSINGLAQGKLITKN